MLTDPVYADALNAGRLPSAGTVIDIGCGRGFMLALLCEASLFERLIGIESRSPTASIARAALGDRAEIVDADARTMSLMDCSAVILFDVLQMMPAPDQEALLRVAREAAGPDGVILIREADASAGWRFNLVRFGNAVKARCIETSRERRHYRTRDQWLTCFERLGLAAEICPSHGRNPLGNLLFRVHRT